MSAALTLSVLAFCSDRKSNQGASFKRGEDRADLLSVERDILPLSKLSAP